MVVHLPAAPHDVADLGVLPPVAGAARHRVAVKEVDVLAGHLGVPHQEAAGGQGRQAGADEVGRLVIHALRLQGAGKRLIVTTGIIHKQHPFPNRFLRFFV